jgi:peptidoglycan/LPS O-acetylase OafA/YrhL
MVVLIYLDRVRAPVAIILGIVLSLLLGALSFHLVEGPCRKGLAQLNLRMACTSLVVLPLLICGPASVIFIRHGMAGRIPMAAEQIFMAIKDRQPQADDCHGDCKNVMPSWFFN